jgi:hypothetical protein
VRCGVLQTFTAILVNLTNTPQESPFTQITITMSDGTLFKPEKDFTETLDKQLPEIEALAKVNDTTLLGAAAK